MYVNKSEMSEPESLPPKPSTNAPVHETRIRSLLDDLGPLSPPIVSSSSCSSSSPSIYPFNGTPEKRLHVGNIPFRWRETELRQVFAVYGETKHVEVVTNERGSKGYGFVTFASGEAADRAIDALSGRKFMGRTIQVNEATTRRQPPVHRPQAAVSNINLGTDQYSSDFGALLLQQKQFLAQQQLQQFLHTQQQTNLIATVLGLPTANLGGLMNGSLPYPVAVLNFDPCALQLQLLQQTLHPMATVPTTQQLYGQLPTVPAGYYAISPTNQLPPMSSPTEMAGPSSSSMVMNRPSSRSDGSTQRFSPY